MAKRQQSQKRVKPKAEAKGTKQPEAKVEDQVEEEAEESEQQDEADQAEGQQQDGNQAEDAEEADTDEEQADDAEDAEEAEDETPLEAKSEDATAKPPAKAAAATKEKPPQQAGFAKGHQSTRPVAGKEPTRPYLDSPREFGIHIEGILVRFLKGKHPVKASGDISKEKVLAALRTDSYVADNGATLVE